MNRVVREHYPVSKLPRELREGLDEGATVRIVVEVEDTPRLDDTALSGFAVLADAPRRSMSAEDAVNAMAKYRKNNTQRVTAEQAVARIRELRDEWDD
ncbi:hypothetical protein ABVB72_07430 [Rhizobium nepotum]|uniref:hypothetical protein n=1 Tax=Rhizobium nepotum TaxID=1035271 RepID=UPI003369EE61